MSTLRTTGILVLAIALALPAADSRAYAQGFVYMEVPKDGRIYVFNDMKAYTEFQQTGDIEEKITRIGAGPNGETMIFDGEEAINLYNFRHNLPGEVIVKPETPALAVQEKLPYKFSGLMFGDYFYNVSRDPNIATQPNVATGGSEDFNAFQFRRIYFTFDDDISTSFTTRFRLEMDQVSLASNLKISVFVKDAYLKWKNVFANSDLTFGIQPTPAYDVSENFWGYRSLDKTIMDLRGIVPSRDFAVSLRGKFDTPGKYNYWIMVGNNSGNSPEIDKYKRFYFHFQYKPSDAFTVTAYEDIKQNPFILDPNNGANHLGNGMYTTAFFASYAKADCFRAGFETFFQHTANGNKIGSAAPFVLRPRNGVGYSLWAWYNFNPKIGVVGRYDHFDPNKDDSFKGDSRNYFIGGLTLKPHKNVSIMPNIQVETYEKIPGGKSFTTSVTPRLTFYCTFP